MHYRKKRSYNFYLIIAHVPFTIDHLLELHIIMASEKKEIAITVDKILMLNHINVMH